MRITEIEAANLAKHYHRWHVEHLGTMANPRPNGVFRILGGQLNSASSAEVRNRKVKDVVGLINEWEIPRAGCLSEVGVNWSIYPSSYNPASWFRDKIQDIKAHTAHSKHENVAHITNEKEAPHLPAGNSQDTPKNAQQTVEDIGNGAQYYSLPIRHTSSGWSPRITSDNTSHEVQPLYSNSSCTIFKTQASLTLHRASLL